jgi:uncharacterized protein YdeI (YjbR/CyaY-like superfamily)
MEPGKTLCVRSREEWHEWLENNYNKEREIWLLVPKLSSGKIRIEYNDAVEEALSFGWIDSTVRRIDNTYSAQRFSRRNPGSRYSHANIERLRWLAREGKLKPEVLDSVKDILTEDFAIPEDILEVIKSSKAAYKNFLNLSPAYIRIRIGFIDAARNRPQEFRKRLNYFIKMTGKNKMFGYGGIEKYY